MTKFCLCLFFCCICRFGVAQITVQEVSTRNDELKPLVYGTAIYFARYMHDTLTIWKKDATGKVTREFPDWPNTAVAGISHNGETIYLHNIPQKKKVKKGISFTTYQDGKWSMPKKIDIPGLQLKGASYDFYVTPDEQMIFISMKGPGTTGQEDLYLVKKEGTSDWRSPVHLQSLCSDSIEATPFLWKDTLFFASNRKGGLGSMDIYYTKATDSSFNEWTVPVNYEAINSAYYDAYPAKMENQLFFASTRNLVSADIYTTLVPARESEKIVVYPELIGRRSLYFRTDSYEIEPSACKELDTLIGLLKTTPYTRIFILGYADPTGQTDYNKDLSQKRAQAVHTYLVDNGIDSSRIFLQGLGADAPPPGNATEEDLAKKRRVEIEISF